MYGENTVPKNKPENYIGRGWSKRRRKDKFNWRLNKPEGLTTAATEKQEQAY